MAMRTISASELKAKCLGVLDDVHETGAEVVVTKHGKPVAKLVPILTARKSLRGAWKSLAKVHGDIVRVDWTDEFEATR